MLDNQSIKECGFSFKKRCFRDVFDVIKAIKRFWIEFNLMFVKRWSSLYTINIKIFHVSVFRNCLNTNKTLKMSCLCKYIDGLHKLTLIYIFKVKYFTFHFCNK